MKNFIIYSLLIIGVVVTSCRFNMRAIFASSFFEETSSKGINVTYSANSTFTLSTTVKNISGRDLTSTVCSIYISGTAPSTYLQTISTEAKASDGSGYILDTNITDNYIQIQSNSGNLVFPLKKDTTMTCSATFKVIKDTPGVVFNVAVAFGAEGNIEEFLTINGNIKITEAPLIPTPTPTPAPIPLPKPAPVVPKVENSPVASVTIPEEFRKEGSQTTDLSKLITESAKSVSNFILDNVGVGSIKYLESVDLSSQDTADKFKNLSNYVQISYGKVSVDSEALGVLNKKAQITLKMNLVDGYEIVILKDGEVVDGAVSNVMYAEGLLSFEVNGFSEYTIKPVLILDETESETDKKMITITGGVSDLRGVVKVIRGEIEMLVEVDRNGNFEIMVDLEEGENVIKVVAISENGLFAEQELLINVNPNIFSSENQGLGTINSSVLIVTVGVLTFIVVTIIVLVILVKKIKDEKMKY